MDQKSEKETLKLIWGEKSMKFQVQVGIQILQVQRSWFFFKILNIQGNE